mmetsp:Transcript_14509/g.22019  ORF Transcript_14509/g.22019 Transcript_14509/m.22019 type:complete len:231 (-) Transcript_14509:10-702(-)
MHLGVLGLLVGSIDAGEALDLPSPGLLVEPLHIAGLHNLEGRIDEDLQERQGGVGMHLASIGSVGGIGRNEPRDHDGTRFGEELGHLCDAADVLLAVLWAEAEVPVQAEAQVVAVQAVDEVGARLVRHQGLLQRHGHRALAAAGQPSHPQSDALVPHGLPLVLPREAFMVLDVVALHCCYCRLFDDCASQGHSQGETTDRSKGSHGEMATAINARMEGEGRKLCGGGGNV